MSLKVKTIFIASLILLLLPHIASAALGVPIIAEPDNLLTLVSRKISVGDYAPNDLVSVGELGDPGIMVREEVLADLKTLAADMAKQGLPIKVNSAYRSFAEQSQLYQEILSTDPKSINTVAEAGFSEHQLGTAIDFTVQRSSKENNPGFANTAQYTWLLANAYKYGFTLSYPTGKESITGFTYEPWHWRYIGKTEADKWHASGLVLKQYLSQKPQEYIKDSLLGQAVMIPGEPTVYFIAPNGLKRGFTTAEAFLFYNIAWTDVLPITAEQLAEFKLAQMVKLPNDPTVYRFNPDHSKQGIASPQAYFNLGFTWGDLVEVNAVELASYKTGAVIK